MADHQPSTATNTSMVTNNTNNTTTNSVLVLQIMLAIIFLAVVPLTVDVLTFPKQVLLFSGSLAWWLWWAIQVWQKQKIRLITHPFMALLGSIIVLTLLSGLLAVNPWQQLSQRFLMIVGAMLLIIGGAHLAPRWRVSHVLNLGQWISLPVGLIYWWQNTPWPLSRYLNTWFNTALPENISFTPLESLLGLLLTTLPLTVATLRWLWNKRRTRHNTWWTTVGLVLWQASYLLHSLFTIYYQANLRPILLPWWAGWSLAVETLKTPRGLLLGVGIEQFLSAFHRARPVLLNLTSQWTFRFQVSSSEFLQTLTTIGLPVALLWLAIIAIGTWWLARSKEGLWSPLGLMWGLQGLSFLLFPWSVSQYALFAATLLAVYNHHRQEYPDTNREIALILTALPWNRDHDGTLAPLSPSAQKLFARGLALIMAIIACGGMWFGWQNYRAHTIYFASLRAATENDAQNMYRWQQAAVRRQPTSTYFRRNFATANIALAQNIAAQDNLTDTQKQTFTQLLQESIQQARLAGQINPTETENWETLANIYTAVMDVPGASDWALLALAQAIQTDPVSPLLRLQMGNLYVEINNLDQARRLYEQAIQLKPNWHTAFYRYAQVLEAQNQLPAALQAYKESLRLISADHDDYNTVLAAVEAAQKKVDAMPKNDDSNQSITVPTDPSVPGTPNVPTPAPQTDRSFEQLLNPTSVQSDSKPGQPATPSGNIVLPQVDL